jgi:hypothetical protein
MSLAPWLQPADYLAAMREGAGLGLNIRAQNQREQEAAAADALRRQSMFQEAQQQQAARALQMQSQQQQAAQALAAQRLHYDQLGQEAMFHNDALDQQDVAHKRADAAQALQADRYNRMFEVQNNRENRLADIADRQATLAEDKYAAGSAANQKLQKQLDAAKGEFKSVYGELAPEHEAAIEAAVTRGEYKTPSVFEQKPISGNRYFANGAENVLNQVDEFNKKYGKDAFQKGYNGKVQAWISALDRGLSQTVTDPKDAEAYAIAQNFQTLFNKKALENSGAAVSPSEQLRNEQAIGTIKSKNFVNELQNFAKDSAYQAADNVRRLKGRRSLAREDVLDAQRYIDKYGFKIDPIIAGGSRPAPADIAPRSGSIPAGWQLLP